MSGEWWCSTAGACCARSASTSRPRKLAWRTASAAAWKPRPGRSWHRHAVAGAPSARLAELTNVELGWLAGVRTRPLSKRVAHAAVRKTPQCGPRPRPAEWGGGRRIPSRAARGPYPPRRYPPPPRWDAMPCHIQRSAGRPSAAGREGVGREAATVPVVVSAQRVSPGSSGSFRSGFTPQARTPRPSQLRSPDLLTPCFHGSLPAHFRLRAALRAK